MAEIRFKRIEPGSALTSPFDTGWRLGVVFGSTVVLLGILGCLATVVVTMLEGK